MYLRTSPARIRTTIGGVHRARAAVALVVVALVAAGCSSSGDADPGPTATTPSTDGPTSSTQLVDPDAASVVTQTATLGGVDLTLTVGPVAVADGVGILRVAAAPTGGEGAVDLSERFGLSWTAGDTIDAVRLVDLPDGRVYLPAMDAEGASIGSEGNTYLRPGDGSETFFVAFAAPTAGSVSVMVPGVALFDAVPVLDAADAPSVAPLTDLTSVPAAKLTLASPALDSFTQDVAGQVSTRVADDVTVAIDSDVLFATASASLSPEADGALVSAGDQLARFPVGTMRVVGHTDDVGDAAENQVLSEQRAQAVTDRLGQLVDLSAYSVTVEGMGATQPVAEGTSDEARALNRRVELVIEASAPGEATSTVVADLPPAQGPEAAGSDGVSIVQPRDGQTELTWDVKLDHVRRVDGAIVGDVQLTNTGTEAAYSVTAFGGTTWDARGEGSASLITGATKLTLLSGGMRLYPLDYVIDDSLYNVDGSGREPLADRQLPPVEAGETIIVTVVWPDVPGDTVVLDSATVTTESGLTGDFGPAFRLTGVPVVG
ncbi:Flagellar motor protein MotB [Sanguibacter gelidistatuariae]|uniref:Flagellar motor protein MotB n=1 Tax=Sanguibacter gelidistatuariae TaxID=1814289 RepID=A0A1G6KSG1_9MICO|nr:OmpA family protein [Sanguibacter gelidistatuariae]SDC33758.1 Flagellar motor protein MotB [Sanguibacter gelidistatuariae]